MKSYTEEKLEIEAQRMRMLLGHVSKAIAEAQHEVDHARDAGQRLAARDALAALKPRESSILAEIDAIEAKITPIREDRERREAEAMPKLAGAREIYDATIARVEAAASDLAKLRDEAEAAAAELQRVKNEAGTQAGFFDIAIPHRIEIGRLADPGSGRDVLVRWRR